MRDTRKIEYHDLREEALGRVLPDLVGRRDELERLDRILERRLNKNVMIVGPQGIGKTALVYGWMKRASKNNRHDTRALLQLTVEHLRALEQESSLEEPYAQALSRLPRCVLFIDNFGREVHKQAPLMQRATRLYARALRRAGVHVILALEPQEYAWLEREYPAFVAEFETFRLKEQCALRCALLFETFRLKEQSAPECARILAKKLPRLNARHHVIVPDSSISEIVSYAERFPSLGEVPTSAIRLLDEAIASSATQGSKVLLHKTIASVVAAKTGVPQAQLDRGALERVRGLEGKLKQRIVSQERAVSKIAATLQRSELGLRNPNRPLGSFLLLGPSGVGKTETAKSVAEIMFGRRESFVRFDMSEFQQEHTVQRLIGAPAGYVGYEGGGALTNALKREPHCLILLDEIEKAHPKVFDIFLQVLDEGRLTSGQSETVDARHCIIMATSNAATTELLQEFQHNPEIDEESFIKETVTPLLASTFRLEFINRFDEILLFKPLGVQELTRIANLEIKKIESRLKRHRVHFDIEPKALEERVRRLSDPRFGARPIKRFVEETCETLLTEALLSTPQTV